MNNDELPEWLRGESTPEPKPIIPAWCDPNAPERKPEPELLGMPMSFLLAFARRLSREEQQEKAAKGECCEQWCHEKQDRDGMCTEHALKFYASE